MALYTRANILFVLIMLPIIWRTCTTYLRRYLVRKFTVTEDVKHLGIARSDDKRIRGSAVVCGGSLGGLWAARICSDHFENVIIVDSEEWLETEEGATAVCDDKGTMHPSSEHKRSRVAQYGCVHVYQVLLLNALRALWPTFDQEMAKRDVRIKPAHFNMHLPLGKLRPDLQEPSGEKLETFAASRKTYEKTLRALVRQQSNIHWVAGTVTGIDSDENDSQSIKSVSVRKSDGSLQELTSALVVDCTGRSQCGLKWLKRTGDKAGERDPQLHASTRELKLPLEKIRMKYDIQSNSRTFEFHVTPSMAERMPIPGGYEDAGWLLTFLPQSGWDNRCIVMSKYEGNRIRLGTLGWGFPELPQTPQDIPNFLRSIRQKVPFPDWLYEVVDVLLEDETWTADTVRVPPCSYIRYDQAAYVPRNFIATGDAVMCANPIWGQGSTKAAIGAIALDSVLRRSSNSTSRKLPSNFSSVFFREHHNKVSSVWDGTKPADYGYDTTIPTDGETLQSEWLMTLFGHYLVKLAIKDKYVDNIVWRARMFLVPPTDMMHPVVLYKMAVLVIKERLGMDS